MNNLVTALVTAATLTLGFSGAAHSASCKANFYQGSNAALLTGHNKNLARENAISSWELKVISSVGPDWKTWKKGTSRNMRCIRNGARRWKCTARARPCKG